MCSWGSSGLKGTAGQRMEVNWLCDDCNDLIPAWVWKPSWVSADCDCPQLELANSIYHCGWKEMCYINRMPSFQLFVILVRIKSYIIKVPHMEDWLRFFKQLYIKYYCHNFEPCVPHALLFSFSYITYNLKWTWKQHYSQTIFRSGARLRLLKLLCRPKSMTAM